MKIVARKRLVVALSALSVLGLALLVTPGCSPSSDAPAKTGSKKAKKTDPGKKTAKTPEQAPAGKTEAEKTVAEKTEAVKTEAVKTEAIKTEAVKTEAVKTEAIKPEPEEKPDVIKPGSDKQAPPGSTAPKRKLKPRNTRTETPAKTAKTEVIAASAPKPETPPAEKPKEERTQAAKPAAEQPKAERPVAVGAEVKPVGTAVAAKPDAAIAANGGSKNPTYATTPAWLPKPVAENAAAEAKAEGEMKPYTEAIPDTDAKFDMVPIKGGKFMMGTSDEEFRRHNPKDESDKNARVKPNDEGPQHEVEIEPFWMGKCEVTWDEYEQWGMKLDCQRRKLKRGDQPPSEREALVDAIAMPTNPYSDMTFGMGKEGFPAICMTQFAAKMYCKWLSAKTGRYYRLPTEAEWEYAARAGTKTAYSLGDDPEKDKLGDFAWFFDNADDKYHKVGQKKPNPWGLHDMHGNAAEWVLGQYTADGYKQFAGHASKNPLAAATTEYGRVVRGGSWADDPPALRSAARRPSTKEWKNQDPQIPQSIWYLTDAKFVGFRVLRPLRVPTAEEAQKYEIDAQQFEQMEDYKKANPGKM